MVSNFRSCKNGQQVLAGSNQPEEAIVKTTLISSTASSPSQVPTLVPVPTLYTQKDLQKITKLCMDLFLQENRREGLRESKLKAQFPDFYYGKLYMECYNSCQQYKDHFNTAGATGLNRTLFATFFLCGQISFRWH